MNDVREQAVKDLVKYVNFQFGNEKNKRCIIKPKGAFKESPYFYAEFDKSGDRFWLRVRVDTITYSENHVCDIIIFKQDLGCPAVMDAAIKRAVCILESIYFNPYYGEFYNEYKKNDEIANYGSIMKRLWNLETEITCCVCNVETATETICGHRICIICWAKVNKVNRKCPLCRNDIKFFAEDSDEED